MVNVCLGKTHVLLRERDEFLKDSGACHISDIFTGSSVVRHVGAFSLNVKDELLHHTLPNTKKEAHSLVGLFGFWRQHILYLGVLL